MDLNEVTFIDKTLALGRAIGLPLGQEFDLADTLSYSDITSVSVDDALQIASKSRSDFRSALDSQNAAAQILSAAKGERYPTVAVNGSYGDIGPTFGNSHGDFMFQAGITVPLFTGELKVISRKPKQNCVNERPKLKTSVGRLIRTFATRFSI